ncbi:alpha/beta hydrolase [Oceanomicrobium pacificus]|uniref:Alpha/beta fold hydrolase n=1 Tax=Oceanomicrobium pacificus TaxID=2692916 RepID=A0A6B0U4R9_9RHOB|nr:alpha/beta fold hydrolase [Oceanomicrobium pacificus]MXU65931.1 alpha/beta fold hydrolase [Oceanomicrobium pacificus]
MTTLTGPIRDAASGNATSLVVLLHGYGADGNDLIGLANPLSQHLPDTRFHAPNAPEPCANNPMGYQWFPIPWLDGSTEEQSKASMAASVDLLNGWLDAVAKNDGIPPERTVLVGFSQGTMMSLHVAPRRPEPFAGIVGFSGRLLAPERLGVELVSRMPVLLVHGDQDQMVPPSSLPEAADALVENGFTVYTHVSKGTGHGIAPDGLGMALQFIKQELG